MTKASREALVESYRLWERLGVGGRTPTNAVVFEYVRAMGHKFKNDEGKALFATFRLARGSKCGPARVAQTCLETVPGGQLGASEGGPTRAGVVLVPLPVTNSSNTKSILSEKSAKPKTVKPTIAPVDFGTIEPLIGIFVANLAAQNKTGRVLDTRIAAMRAELHVAMLAHNHPSSFASGLAVANRAGIANVNYVRRVAETERDQAPKFALTAVAPIEYAGYVRTADAMWHPFRGTKRVVGWADGLPPGLLPERFSDTPWSEAVAAKAQQTADEMAESA